MPTTLNSHQKRELRAIEHSLRTTTVAIPLPIKLRVAEILLRIKERIKEPFGLFLILGWQKKWQKFGVIPDVSQDLFAGRDITHRSAEMQTETPPRAIMGTLLFDGAIVIDHTGTILHSGVMIEGLRPREAASKLRPGKFSDLSAQFGFKEKVHTRHLTAITSSYTFKGTTVFTISEESGSMHIFENGRIIYASPKRKK